MCLCPSINALNVFGIGIRSVSDRKYRSGITMLEINSPDAVAQALKKRKVFVSTQGGLLRVSVHFYNVREDIDRFVVELNRIVKDQ